LRPNDCRIDGRKEGGHRVIFRHEEEIYRAVGARDVTVKADAQTEDDFAHDAAL